MFYYYYYYHYYYCYYYYYHTSREPGYESIPSFSICGKRYNLCFRYKDNLQFIIFFLNPKLQDSTVIKLCLCQTWSETQKISFLVTRLIKVNSVSEKNSENHCDSSVLFLVKKYAKTRN